MHLHLDLTGMESKSYSMNNNETVNELCHVLKLIHEYCEGRVVWGDSDRERWEYVSRLAKQALKSAQ